jgi:hypothetical protein
MVVWCWSLLFTESSLAPSSLSGIRGQCAFSRRKLVCPSTLPRFPLYGALSASTSLRASFVIVCFGPQNCYLLRSHETVQVTLMPPINQGGKGRNQSMCWKPCPIEWPPKFNPIVDQIQGLSWCRRKRTRWTGYIGMDHRSEHTYNLPTDFIMMRSRTLVAALPNLPILPRTNGLSFGRLASLHWTLTVISSIEAL